MTTEPASAPAPAMPKISNYLLAANRLALAGFPATAAACLAIARREQSFELLNIKKNLP